MTREEIDTLRKEAEAIRENLGAKLDQIREAESNCQHDWSEPKRIYSDTYDAYNRKWERTCSNCGKVDWTMREAMKPVPIFGDDNAGKFTISLPHG